jgi:hypothetical protein
MTTKKPRTEQARMRKLPMAETKKLQGRVAVITGDTTGIGLHTLKA